MLASNPTAFTNSTKTGKTDYNALLIAGYNSFQNKELTRALAYYQDALATNPDATSGALVHSIIGVLHMHGCNYPEAINAFSEGLKLIDKATNERQPNKNGNYQQLSVLVKLQANLALCYLVIGEYKEALERVNRCLQVVKSAHQSIKGDLFQSLMYIFFRFTSFAVLKNADTDSPESKYDDVTQACFYSTMAVNKDLCSTPEEAYRLQRKALDIWTAKKQYGFMLISQRHLLHLAKQLDRKKDISEYERQIARTLQSEQLQGISDKTLFKGYQQKMKAAKDITTMLATFERSQQFNDVHEIAGWRQATRLRLLQAVNMSKRSLAEGNPKNRQQVQKGIDQLQHTIRSLETQRNVLVERNLQKSKFVVEAVNYLKAQSHRFFKFYEKKRKDELELGFNIWRKWNYSVAEYEQQQQDQRSQRQPTIGSRYQLPPPPPLPNDNIYRSGNPAHMSNFGTNDQRRLGTTSNISNSSRGERPDPKYTTVIVPNQRIEQPPIGSLPSGFRTGSRTGRMQPEPPIGATVPGRMFNPTQSVSPIRNVDRPTSPALTSRTNNNDTSYIYSKDDPETNRRITKYIRKCEAGQYLLKRHFTSDGGDEKFVKLTKTDIRWANDEDKIMKTGKNQIYLLTDVRGIVYGKVTETMRKGCNKDLQPWKCFSLILKKRTLDIYCPEEQDIDYWVPGLSGAIARANPDKLMIGYTPGKMLWTKMFLILNHHFIEPRGKYERRHAVPFAVALSKFLKNGLRIPHRKK